MNNFPYKDYKCLIFKRLLAATCFRSRRLNYGEVNASFFLNNLIQNKFLFCIVIFYVFLLPRVLFAGAVPISVYKQEQTNWCWAATVNSMMNYYGINMSQCEIVNFSTYNTNNLCCLYPTSSSCNVGGSMINNLPNRRGQQSILLQYASITSQFNARSLTPSETKAELDAGRPFIIGWKWPQPDGIDQGGHILNVSAFVGDGTGAFMQIDDPGIGVPDHITTNYSGAVGLPVTDPQSSHYWIESLRITNKTKPSINIKANNQEGPNITVNSGQNVLVQVSVRPNGNFSPSEWWIAIDLQGIRYYLKPDGSVTTTPTYWRRQNLNTINLTAYNGLFAKGIAKIWFGVDLNQNGLLDYNGLLWDFIEINTL